MAGRHDYSAGPKRVYTLNKHVVDPETGSELHFLAHDTSKEGGVAYRFEFRDGQDLPSLDFFALVSGHTHMERDRYRKDRGLPKLATLWESYEDLLRYSEKFGSSARVAELDLLQDGPAAVRQSYDGPGRWKIDWDRLPDSQWRKMVSAFTRCYFLANATRPEGSGFYPDRLTFGPHNMPGKFVEYAKAPGAPPPAESQSERFGKFIAAIRDRFSRD